MIKKNRHRVFITGINGFVGSHLSDLLNSQDYIISGLAYSREIRNIAHLKETLDLHYGDIRDIALLGGIISKVQPDYIYHLAGQPFVPDAEKNILHTYEVNILGTLNLLEVVRISGLKPRILTVSSGEIYGVVPEHHLPVNEDYPLKPINPYAVTKACADLLTYQYSLSHQLDLIRVRPFTHIGPRQSERFVCSNFAKQIAEMELGLREPVLKVGNLDMKRDFTDVRDIVRAYQTILERAKGGDVYNVGSSKCWRIWDIVEILQKETTAKKFTIQQEQFRVRATDNPVMHCDFSKLQKQFSWKPEIPIVQTVRDLLGYWRKNVN